MRIERCPENPIITPADVLPTRNDFEVIGTFNAGVASFENQIILLIRVAERPVSDTSDSLSVPVYQPHKNSITIKRFSHNDPQLDTSDPRAIHTSQGVWLTSISHFRLARSNDGVNFRIDSSPAMFPANKYETMGIEDPRITPIDDEFYITYSAVSPLGVTTCLAKTSDFINFQRLGIIFPPHNKDVVLFPEKIDGFYWALHRPVEPLFEKRDIWLAASPDLLCWGHHRHLMSLQSGQWEHQRLGASTVPLKTEKGWLEIYHSLDQTGRYCLGTVLLDREKPWKILARSTRPFMSPREHYETEGFFGNVIFSCGCVLDSETLILYYGTADTTLACARLSFRELLNHIQ